MCDPRCGLSWKMFHVHLRRRCILLNLNGMSLRYQWDPSRLMYHLKLLFPYWFSVLMICPLVWGCCESLLLLLCYCQFLLLCLSVFVLCIEVLLYWVHQFSSVTQSCLTLCNPTDYSTLGLRVHHQLPESTQNHVHWVMPCNHLILCHPLLLLPSIFPSIRIFSNESALHIRWPKYWSFSFSISPSNEYSRLISFRKDWLDLLAVQGTLKSLL